MSDQPQDVTVTVTLKSGAVIKHVINEVPLNDLAGDLDDAWKGNPDAPASLNVGPTQIKISEIAAMTWGAAVSND